MDQNRVTRFYDNVYYMSWFDAQNPRAQRNWNGADEFCKLHCMELLILNNQEEENFVASEIVRGKEELNRGCVTEHFSFR